MPCAEGDVVEPLEQYLPLRAHASPPPLPPPPGPQEYLCRRCGATYTSLDAMRLLDPMSGAFHCEECRGELEANVDVAGGGWGGREATI